MKFLLVMISLIVMTGCARECRAPKFQNGQTIQLVDGKAKGTIVGTRCDGAGPCLCSYRVKLNSSLYINEMVGEFEIEEAK